MYTLVVLYPGCIELEVTAGAELCGRVHPCVVVTPDGRDHIGSSGMVIRADASYERAPVIDVRAALIAGGDPGSVLEDAHLPGLLNELHERGSVVGAICAGPLLLAKAGLLAGRRFTHGYGKEQERFVGAYFQGGTCVDEPVVTDGRIVTAKAPAFIAFGIEVARLSGAARMRGETGDAAANHLRAYYGVA